MKKIVSTMLFLGCAAMGALAQGAPVYVGSFAVGDGPIWISNPPVYSGQEAAALIYGGSPGDYFISTDSNTTDPGTITHTAWYDGWGENCTEFAESYSLDNAPAGYQYPAGTGNAWSAYVNDHDCGELSMNYVWRANGQVNPPAQAAKIPTMNLPALLSLAGLLAVFGIRRLRAAR